MYTIHVSLRQFPLQNSKDKISKKKKVVVELNDNGDNDVDSNLVKDTPKPGKEGSVDQEALKHLFSSRDEVALFDTLQAMDKVSGEPVRTCLCFSTNRVVFVCIRFLW